MQEVYLDNAATTQTQKDVAALALEMMCSEYGNPSSLHNKGFRAQQAVDKAREQIADAVGATSQEIVFTSGGTEANNLAIIGGVETVRRRGNKIITTQVEHASVLEPLAHLENIGYTVIRLKPLKNGGLDLQALEEALDDQVIFVSAMLVNSEVGTISQVGKAATLIRRKSPHALIHTDAVQGFGKIPFSANRLGVDFLSMSGHKIHGPKGVGALYIRRNARLTPLLFGGGQETGLRSGTENTPGIAGFGHAALLASHHLNENFSKVRGLSQYFLDKAEKAPGIRVNSSEEGTPYICNLSAPGYRSEILLHYLEEQGIYVSSGSACSKGQKSHVLTAMGLTNQRMDSALRVSFCADNTTEEIDSFFEHLQKGREQLIRS